MDHSAPISNGLRGPLRKRESSLWVRQPEDWYVEPFWVSARLFEVETFRGSIHDPAAGSGRIMVSAPGLGPISGSDIVVRTTVPPIERRDWLEPCDKKWDNIVSNPPFKLCDDRRAGTHPFVERCLERAERKVALLLPANWIQGDKRSRWLETTPLRRVWFISPRPSMPPGEVIAAGSKPGNGTTDYAWLVFDHGYDGHPEVRWLRRDP